eukprot:comp11520_c0_seq1/m.5968 comp11520_c0_seq1/g.5968  ORF comp11520_c0_seq1/g.5968 comp11520_c0_seq1/m.5968 type:complete len:319 (-) comp11520_c0_seq1:418-1374(-)
MELPNTPQHRPSISITATESDYDEILLEPYTYLSQIPGKEVRRLLTVAFNRWLQIPEDKMATIQEVVTMLHNASLLVDDIEDNSKLRRGVPVAHSMYGIASTINCANYVYFLAMEKVVPLNNFEAMKILTEELIELHRGQGKDIYWRDTNVCPTEAEYIKMVKQKTGGLFRLAVKLMQIFSENKNDFMPLLDNLGLYFQIRDDYINLVDTEYMQGKSFCEDLTEGKFSFPIIHAILANTKNRQLLNVLKKQTEDIDVKKYCLDYMRKMGSFTYTREYLEQLADELTRQIAALGSNPDLEALIQKLRQAHKNPAPAASV